MTTTVCALIRNPECSSSLIRDALIEQGFDVATIYAIVGSTGEYSDYSTWIVAAYLLPEQAEAACEKLNAWCREHNLHDGSADWPTRHNLKPPDDPNFSCDYNGTTYSVEPIELRAT